MNIKINKTIIIIFVLVLFLFIISIFNRNYNRTRINIDDDIYKNDISKILQDNNSEEIVKIDYEKLLKDLNDIDIILKEQISSDIDLSKKSSYYKIASQVYDKKIIELLRILNDRLDDEDFGHVQNDLDEFQKNIDFAMIDFDEKLESTVDREYYINKYLYEEKYRKCHELLETYKGFLQ